MFGLMGVRILMPRHYVAIYFSVKQLEQESVIFQLYIGRNIVCISKHRPKLQNEIPNILEFGESGRKAE